MSICIKCNECKTDKIQSILKNSGSRKKFGFLVERSIMKQVSTWDAGNTQSEKEASNTPVEIQA